MSKPFKASKKSHCHLCDSSIVPGEHITWPRRGDDRRWRHAHCNVLCTCEDTPEVGQPAFQTTLGLNGASNGLSAPQANGNGHLSHANGAASISDVSSAPQAAAAAVGALAAVIEPLIAARVMEADAIRDLVQDEIQAALAALPEPEPQVTRLQVVTPIGQVNEIQGKVHKQFKKVLALAGQRKDIYLFGPAGGGKSTVARQVAEGLGLQYSTVTLNVQTSESRLFGYLNATGEYVSTEFRKRYEFGGIMLVDEADNATGNLLTSLNTCLANGHHAFPDQTVARHADFICIAAGNTAGRGASRQHADRRQFDAAFADRFFFLSWQYDEDLERDAALSYTPDAKHWVEWVQLVRLHVSEQALHHVCVTPRASIEGAKLIAAGFSADLGMADGLVFKGLESSQVDSILRTCPLPA